MRAKLHDLRLLYLAHEVEETFEGLEKAIVRHLPPDVQASLQPLFEGGPNHKRLEDSLKRLNAEVEIRQKELSVHELLDVLRGCEAMAKDFYIRHAADLSDPDLAALFRGLASEEARHHAAVEKALAQAGPNRAPGMRGPP